jgi:ABC-2 type transport system permease protein
MNIYCFEWKANLRFTLNWTISLILMTIVFLFMYTSFSADMESFTQLMEGFPEEVRLALGMQIEEMGSFLGFYAYAFTFITLIGAIQAMILGVSIVSKEIREKTADFLLSKPITRSHVLKQKALAALTSLVVTNLLFNLVATIMAFVVAADFHYGKFLLISLTMFYVQLIFLAMGIFVAVVFSKIKNVLPISLGIVFGFFTLAAFGSTTGDEPLRYLTPLKYFDPYKIIQTTRYELSFSITTVLLILIFMVASFYIYNKKDIESL